jgi:hypothetical protein
MSERADDGGDAPRDKAEATARKQREIQAAQDRKDRENGGRVGQAGDETARAGAREHSDRLPAQHLQEPGSEGAPAGKGAEFGKDTEMKRPAQPEELSPAYVFLASPICSGYINGIVLPVTGSLRAI